MIFSDIIKEHKTGVFPKIEFHQQKILSIIEKCRTPLMGSHLYVCRECESVLLLHNSCSNRNCPVCQGNKRKRWIDKQCNNLINAPYFHVVFTIPDVLNSLFLNHQNQCYNALFHAAWDTLKQFFKNDKILNGKGGMLSILHTWGQNLSFHPHIHCLVPGAGISNTGEFKPIKGGHKFLFNVKSLAKVFRAKFAENISSEEKKGNLKISPIVRKMMFTKNWVVFSQRPFSTPENVVRYIGMYSHRVAICENRIIDNKNGIVSFFYKDYKDGGTKKTMQLTGEEFIRRFSLHILPFRFTKIRYYGELNNRNINNFTRIAQNSVGLYKENICVETEQIPEKEINTDNGVSQNNAIDFDLDYGLDDEHSVSKKTSIICPFCKKAFLHKLLAISYEDYNTGIIVVNSGSGEILFHCRAGPFCNSAQIIEIRF